VVQGQQVNLLLRVKVCSPLFFAPRFVFS